MKTNTWIILLAALAVATMLWGGTALAQGQPASCDQVKASTPEKLEGQVISVDVGGGKLTLRGSDGKTHELQASRETLQGYKVGDRIEAKLRSMPNCR